MWAKRTFFFLAPILVLTQTSCAMLANLQGEVGGLNLRRPTIAYQGATLVRAPSQKLLAAYYCPEVISVPLGGAGLLCQQFFGPRPAPSSMSVVFDLHFRVSNPNQIPVPLASVLTGATLFPASASQRLGAVCVQLCPEGQPGCSGQAAAGACQASSRDVRSLSDFGGAAANFLLAAGVGAATGQPVGFTAPKVSQAAQLDVTVRFTLGPSEVLAAMRQLAVQSVGELKAGRNVTFTIPYRLEGTVWFDVGSLGRVAVGFGPSDGIWALPLQ
jgi:hypothetical protein